MIMGDFVALFSRLSRRRHFVFIGAFVLLVIITVIYNTNSRSKTVIKPPLDVINNRHEELRDKSSEDIAQNIVHVMPNFDNMIVVNRHEEPLVNRIATINLDKIRTPKSSKYVPHKRLVHLDLKGAAPKVSYFEKLFPLLRRAGANGLMIEWEDMFPFEGELQFATHNRSYTKQQVREILKLAKQSELEVIPLIQSFGHLEYFLKLPKYRHLRELDEYPQAICPSKPDAFKLVTDIIDQVMAMHPDARFLHIGCDEVFQLGSCDACRQKDRDELFLNHVYKVAKYVHENHKVAPIIWDDMLRQFTVDFMKKYDFKSVGLEIMIWTYIDDIYRFIPYGQFMAFSEIFPRIWGASAFKGAFGETLTIPNAKMHLDNNIAWIGAMNGQSASFDIQGLVITGWQRYDHLGNLCELLPSGLPSLMIDLLTITKGEYDSSLFNKLDELLKCSKYTRYDPKTILDRDPLLVSKQFCEFPGVEVFRIMAQFQNLNKEINDYLYDVTTHKAWLTDYNAAHNITSPMRIEEALQNYHHHYNDLKGLIPEVINAFSTVFEDYTALEWIEQKIYPQLIRLEKFYNRTQTLQKLRLWPKRPLKPVADLYRFLPQSSKSEMRRR